MPPKKKKKKLREKVEDTKPMNEMTSDELMERIFSKEIVGKLKEIVQDLDKKKSK
jgi:hypothetical protein